MTERHDPPAHNDAARWNAMAASYERWAEPLTMPFARAALSLAGGLGPGERVLDVAAGTGALALVAAEAGARVLATDFSPGMVARLRERLAPFPGGDARVMDGQALEVEDASFDLGASMFGVMMFPDWRRGLAELARAIRPGGRVIVATWVDPEGAGPSLLLRHAYRRVRPDAALPAPPTGMTILCTAEGLQTELRAAGCDEVAVHAVERPWGAPALDAAAAELDEMLRMFPHLAGLDDEARARLRGLLRADLEAHVGPDGAVRLPVTAKIAIGRRPR